jgi:hypothetical protein
MKHSTKKSKYEPTISDVLDVVQTGFARHDKMFASLHEGQQNLGEQVNDVERRLTNTQNRVEDIADMLELDHERRIKRLEQVRK